MTKLRSYVDDNFSGRDWNLATAMVIKGEAGVQFMGDWAKGEFLNAGKVPGKDFLCFRFPGTQGTVTFNSDQFAMFKVGRRQGAAQLELATAIDEPGFQSAFNVVKGSVPARTDVLRRRLRRLRQEGHGGPQGGQRRRHAVRLAWRMAMPHPASVKNAIYDVVTAHFNGAVRRRRGGQRSWSRRSPPRK